MSRRRTEAEPPGRARRRLGRGERGFAAPRRLGLALLCVALAAPADPPDARETGAHARRLLVDQHVPEALERLEALAAELAAGEAPAPPRDRELDWGPRVQRAFAGERLFEAVVARMAERYEHGPAQAFARFFDTPLGAAVLACEARTLEEPETPARFRAFLEDLAAQPLPQEREALAERLERAMGSSEMTAAALVAIRQGLRRAWLGDAEQRGAGERALLETLRQVDAAQTRAAVRTLSLQGLLFTYRSLSGEELAELARFAESDAAQWFYRTLNEAVGEAVAEAAAAFESEIADLAPRLPP